MSMFDQMADIGRRMPARDRRAITLGMTLLAPFVLYFLVIRPYRTSLADIKDNIEIERGRLSREEGILAMGPSLPRLANAATERAKRADLRLVRGANRALEEAELTTYLERTASLSRVLLQESRGLEPPRGSDTTGVVRPIRLAVRGESDLKGVLTYIQRIEASPLLLHIAELSMEPVKTKTSSDTQDGVIKFALVLEAYAPTGVTAGSQTKRRETIQ